MGLKLLLRLLAQLLYLGMQYPEKSTRLPNQYKLRCSLLYECFLLLREMAHENLQIPPFHWLIGLI